jgi:hypothetical protein
MFFKLSCIIASLALLLLAAACASMQVPGNATTRTLGGISTVTGDLAPVAGLIPVPWGWIAGVVLGAVSVITGVIAHSTLSKNSAREGANAAVLGMLAAQTSEPIHRGSGQSPPP